MDANHCLFSSHGMANHHPARVLSVVSCGSPTLLLTVGCRRGLAAVDAHTHAQRTSTRRTDRRWRVRNATDWLACSFGGGVIRHRDQPNLRACRGQQLPRGRMVESVGATGSPARDGPSMSLDKVLRRSVNDNAWDEESDEVWRGRDRSSRYGRVLGPRETEG